MKRILVDEVVTRGITKHLISLKSSIWKSVLVQEYLGEFLARKEPTLHSNTVMDYRQVINEHINPIIGKIKLKELNLNNIQFLYSTKLENGISPSRVRYIHAVLHSALNLAVKWGYIDSNPAKHVTKPKVPHKEMNILTIEEVKIFLDAVKGTRLEALYNLAITTGIRKAEICGLKWRDLCWDTGNLQIQRQLQRIRGKGLVFSPPKCASSRRLIVLGPGLLKILKQHEYRQGLEVRKAGATWQRLDLIFPREDGTPIRPRDLNRDFKDRLKRSKLPDIRFHDLRHCAASFMFLCGIHPRIASEILGHSRIGITLDTYSHLLPGMKMDAALKLDELLG